ncbi:MAG: hypothetical protein K6F56_04625 [Oscillospiraceae bacterium]|nr:hypothetical protein [Oscillospiraceae bacterium]
MKTEIITINSQGQGMEEALAMTESLGAESGLAEEEKLHLRLLAEELFGMLRSVAGELAAEYWIIKEDRQFELHMKSEVSLTDEMREQLISASTSGENAAGKGIMGKIRLMIGEVFLSRSSEAVIASGLAMSLMSTASAIGQSTGADAYLWSLNQYREEVEGSLTKDKGEAWDELEKSIIAKLADEVKVWIVGSSAEITVYKAF